MITAERLREVVTYDPTTGVFRWREKISKKVRVGAVAGNTCGDGRPYIRIEGRNYVAARLAWLYVRGTWPAADIDHVDGNHADNRLCNLREATRAQNMANKRRHKNCSSGVKGVEFHKLTGRWVARIRCNNVRRYIGIYDTKEEAASAYWLAAKETFGEFATMRG